MLAGRPARTMPAGGAGLVLHRRTRFRRDGDGGRQQFSCRNHGTQKTASQMPPLRPGANPRPVAVRAAVAIPNRAELARRENTAGARPDARAPGRLTRGRGRVVARRRCFHRRLTVRPKEQPMSTAPRSIVIVGGGFAGVYAARHLERRLPAGWRLTLFSQENHFIFTPLLGDVVGSSINPMHVVWPIRQMVRRAACRTATLTGIDLAARRVQYKTAAGQPAEQDYDHLVLACGSAV